MSEIRRRIMRRVKKRGKCWEWTGAHGSKGHGRIRVAGKLESPHRLMWEEENGPIPDGLWVLHECDNPPCVNPAHLFLGTRSDNMLDAAAKGRLHVEKPWLQTKERNGKVWCNRCEAFLLPKAFGRRKDAGPRGWRYASYCKKCERKRQKKYSKHAKRA